MTLVGGVLLGMSGVLRVRLVLAVARVGGEGVVGVMRGLAVVVLVEAAARAAASCTGGVLVRAGGPARQVGLADHAQQTCWGGRGGEVRGGEGVTQHRSTSCYLNVSYFREKKILSSHPLTHRCRQSK